MSGARRPTAGAAAALAIGVLAGCRASPGAPSEPAGVTRLGHIVVIFLENRSFDHLYGEFAEAEGRSAAALAAPQVDASGTPYPTLPQVGGSPFPTDLPNAPFSIESYVPADQPTRDLVHRFYQEQEQINGGLMNRFAVVSDARGLVMGYYHTLALPLAAEAAEYTLCDRFFHAAFGGSFLNHIWLIAAASPPFPAAPAGMVAQLDAQGALVQDGAVTPDGYAVNTVHSVNSPHPAGTPVATLMPSLTLPTIGDRLDAAGVSWAWYAGGWTNAVAGQPDATYQYHHQPFIYFANYADGTAGRAAHLKDEGDFLSAAAAGTLPAVSFVKPLGVHNEHPGGTNLLNGETHTLALINAVRNGPAWKDAAIIVTYDENGGFWDHLGPPAGDRWGPGTRVPAIVISPFARKGYVDHTIYDTTSILSLIELRYQLQPLSARDAAADPLSGAFDFSQ